MRGRGIDFEHRFNTSRWAEDLLLKSICESKVGLVAARYGLSAVSTVIDIGDVSIKEPDILVYKTAELTEAELTYLLSTDLSLIARSYFAEGTEYHFVHAKSVCAIEVEFSPYKAKEMVGRHWSPRTIEQWEKRPLKHANPPIAPNIWVKDEDLQRLGTWQSRFSTPMLVIHIFDQEAFAVRLETILEFNSQLQKGKLCHKMMMMTRGIFKKSQSYDRTDAQGAGETKDVFVVTPSAAIKAGDVVDVEVSAQIGLSSSKKYVTHVVFSAGKLKLADEFIAAISDLGI
jgi:hypothetical protein